MSTMPSETDETDKNNIQELITMVLQQANEISYDLFYFKMKSRGINMKIQNDINSFKLYADKSVLHSLDEMCLKKEDSFKKMLNALNDRNLELKKVAAVIAELRKLSNPKDPSSNITEPSPKQTCNKLQALNNALYYKNLHMKWFSAWLKTQLAHKRLQQEATINLLKMCLQNEDNFQTSSPTNKHVSSSKVTPSLSDMINEINKMIGNLSLKSADEVSASKPSTFDEKQPPTFESGSTDIHSETKPQITGSPSNPKVYIFGVKPKASEPTPVTQKSSSKCQPRIFKSAKRTSKPHDKDLPKNPFTNVFEAETTTTKIDSSKLTQTSPPEPLKCETPIFKFTNVFEAKTKSTKIDSSKPTQTSQEPLKCEPTIFKFENQAESRKPQIDKLKDVKPNLFDPKPTTSIDSKNNQASQEPKFELPTFKTFKFKQATTINNETIKPQPHGPSSNEKVYIFGAETTTSEPTQASQESTLKCQPPIFKFANQEETNKPQTNDLPKNPMSKLFETKPTTSNSVDSSNGSRDEVNPSNLQGYVTSLNCRTIRIGSYRYTPKEKVFISSSGIKIVAPSLKNESRDVALQINLKEVVRILVHFGKGLPVIFLYTMIRTGQYIRNYLDMVEDSGPFYDPMSKVDPYRRITLLPEAITDEAKSALIALFGKVMDELTSREANEILVRTCPKELDNVSKMATRSSSVSSERDIEPNQAPHESLKVDPPIFKSNVKNDTKPQINSLLRNTPTQPFEAKSTPTTANNVDSNSTQASKESASNNLPRRPRLLKSFRYKSAKVNNENSKPQNNGPPCNPRDNPAGGEPMTSDGKPPVRFSPPIGIDVIDNTKVRYQYITSIKEFENKSLEELRFEDYIAGRKGPSLYVFESRPKNNATFPSKPTRINVTSAHNIETPTQKSATSTQHRETQYFDTPKQNQERPAHSFDSSAQNRETTTSHFNTSKHEFETLAQNRETVQKFDSPTRNRETSAQKFGSPTRNRETAQKFDSPTKNRETPTQHFDTSTQNREKPTQHFETSTQNREKPTQHFETSTQNREKPTQHFDISTQNRESPTQFFDTITQDRETPTKFFDCQTQNQESPTQFVDSQTQNRESPTQFVDSQTQNQETSTRNRETTPDLEQSVSDENETAIERLLVAGQIEEAFKLSSDALKLDPENANFLVLRARAYYDLKKYLEALEDFQKAVGILPILPANVSVYVAKCCLRLGHIASGEQAMRHALERNLGRKTPVLETLSTAFVSLRSWQETAHRLMSQNKHFDAVYYIDNCLINYCPACSMMKLLKAECLAHMGKFNEARSIAIDTSLLCKNVCSGAVYADAMYVVGLCSYYQEHDDMALKKFRKVLEHDPDHEKAIKMLKLTKTRKNTKLIIQKKEEGNKAFKAGVWTRALKLYNEALSIDKNNKQENAKLHYNIATVFAKQNQLSNAIDACTAALDLDNNYIKPLLRRAQCYTEIGMYEKALEDYEKLYYIDSTDEYNRLLQEANDRLMANKGPYYYYKLLGISKYASMDEIKKAYKKCAMRYHPDRHPCASLGEVRTNERKFKQAKEAYDALNETHSRANYDRTQSRYDTESEDEW